MSTLQYSIYYPYNILYYYYRKKTFLSQWLQDLSYDSFALYIMSLLDLKILIVKGQ